MNITLAQYFAAHAPVEIPAWFTDGTKHPTAPSRDPAKHGLISPRVAEVLETWRDDPCDDFELDELSEQDRETARKYIAAWQAHWKSSREYQEAKMENTFFAWREFYGREMAKRMRDEPATSEVKF